MESGFLNNKKSSSTTGLTARIKNIDGKVIVNEGEPLKSILKHTGLSSKTGSIKLPNEVGSGSIGSDVALAGTNQKSTLVEEVMNTYSSPIAACEKSCDDGVLIGKAGHDDTLKDPPSRYDVPSLVETDLSKPDLDTSNIDDNSKVQDSGSTSVCTNLGAKVVIPITVVEDMCQKFSNTLYGYSIGQRLAFPLVEDYVKYAWAKFGFQRVILRGSFFFFQFSSQEGLLKVLEGGPWFIRSTPIFLDNWVANTKLEKEVITKVPIWVRFHNLPAVVYSETGIRLIAERVGRLMRLDEGTSAMCINPWGRYSYARCLIELSDVHDILEFVEVDIPLPNGKGHYTEYIDIEYEWWPPRCSHCKIFGHEVGICQVLKRRVDLGPDDEFVSPKEKVHNKKAGKKGTKSQKGSRFFKPKSTFIYRPVSKPSSNQATKEDKPNEHLHSTPPLVTNEDLSQSVNEFGYFKDNINLDELKRDMEKVWEAEKVLDLASTSSNVEGVGNGSALQLNKEVSNSPTNIASSVGDPSASGSLWEQFNASTSNNKSPVSGSEDSDDEVDEVLMPEGGGFLDDMEDYYDGYDDQVVLPEKLQAFCDHFDIRLNTRRR